MSYDNPRFERKFEPISPAEDAVQVALNLMEVSR